MSSFGTPPSLTSLSTPKTVSTSKTIAGYKIVSIGIDLGVSATIQVSLHDTTGSLIQNKSFILSGTDYTNWGSSDIPYIDEFIVSQINSLTSL
jgi:hypothetical protein